MQGQSVTVTTVDEYTVYVLLLTAKVVGPLHVVWKVDVEMTVVV